MSTFISTNALEATKKKEYKSQRNTHTINDSEEEKDDNKIEASTVPYVPLGRKSV